MMHRIYVVGMGPGREDMMTEQAKHVLSEADVIVGYPVYVKLLNEELQKKEILTTPMRQEKERCHMAFKEAEKGKKVVLICSGDAGVYGLAGLMYEIGREYQETEVLVIPGITAANSGAACLGAPLNHDFCVISLSDLLTPWDKIKRRLRAAAEGDFCMAIYNPSSKKRADYLKKACDILLEYLPGERICGYVENIGRENTAVRICTLEELREAKVNMFTTVYVGNAATENINGKMVAKRGYEI